MSGGRHRLVAALALAHFLTATGTGHAVSISLDYVDPADSFFSTQAKATLAKAASDLSTAITTTLAPLNSSFYQGTSLATTANATWQLSYTNPNTGSSTPFTAVDLEENEFRIFVGRRSLPGSTLGLGGTSSTALAVSANGSPSSIVAAVENLEINSDAGMLRGGPLLSSLSGSITLGDVIAPYTLSYGYVIGSVAFSDSVDWHRDYLTLPTPGTNDLYSVALHEMMHAIGFGTGGTWSSNVSGTTWLGPAVAALLGTGANALSGDLSHIAFNLSGRPFVNGAFLESSQEAALDPSLTSGTRKFLTDLDLAFLADMGWAVVPEPPALPAILLAFAAFAFLRSSPSPPLRTRGNSAN